MKKTLFVGIVLAGLALVGIGSALADPPPQAKGPGRMCPMCAGAMEPGPGCPGGMMGPGEGMGMHHMGMGAMMDPKTTIKMTQNADGVTITVSNPDKTTAQQLQRMAQIFVLEHEMMRTHMMQMQQGREEAPAHPAK